MSMHCYFDLTNFWVNWCHSLRVVGLFIFNARVSPSFPAGSLKVGTHTHTFKIHPQAFSDVQVSWVWQLLFEVDFEACFASLLRFLFQFLHWLEDICMLICSAIPSSLCLCNVSRATWCHTTLQLHFSTPVFNTWQGVQTLSALASVTRFQVRLVFVSLLCAIHWGSNRLIRCLCTSKLELHFWDFLIFWEKKNSISALTFEERLFF